MAELLLKVLGIVIILLVCWYLVKRMNEYEPVIHCENCKHADTFVGDEDAWCDKHCIWLTRKDFCSRGERRDAE